MIKTANIFSQFTKGRKTVKSAKKLLKAQNKSDVHRPDLIESINKDLASGTKDVKSAVAKGVGGVAVAGVGAKVIKDQVDDKARRAKENLGHRGTEYGGIII